MAPNDFKVEVTISLWFAQIMEIMKKVLVYSIVGYLLCTGIDASFCKDKVDGNYKDPDMCEGYIACSGKYAHKMPCPANLHYNEKGDYCDWPHNLKPKCEPGKPEVDPCSVNNGGCQQRCANEDGNAKCSCKEGFNLQTDKKTCLKDALPTPPIPPLPPMTPPCGRDKKLNLGEIVGGTNAPANKWIWQGGIYYDDEFLCGGTLIKENMLLTAAHCVDGREAKYMFVRMGDHKRGTIEPATEQSQEVDQVIVHRDWDWGTIENDIAILTFKENFKMDDNVGIACLPIPMGDVEETAACYITGWGKTHIDEPLADILQQAKMPIVPREKCIKQNSNGDGVSKVSKNMICGGFQGTDTELSGCKGDSGGPFVCKEKNQDHWVLQGVVSWGSSRCSASHRYTVFTQVSKYIDWIESEMYPDP